jgi:nicotinate-nucleotide adenylyltransferase
LKKRVGIFGGSFDPVHYGHIEAVRSFISSGLVDEVWVMLTPDPPHKKNKIQAAYDNRLEMLNIALSNISGVKISEVEQQLPKPSYTLQTLKHLKEKHPDYMFYLCLGEDSITHFHEWFKFHEILETCNLLAVERPGFDSSGTDPKILEKTIFLDHKPYDVSSTKIRKTGNTQARFDVPEKVAEYIHKHKLYQNKD